MAVLPSGIYSLQHAKGWQATEKSFARECGRFFLATLENFMSQASTDRNSLLHFAVSVARNPLVLSLLADRADVNAKNRFGQTPLHIAYKHRQFENAMLLIRHGASLSVTDSYGLLPLDYDVSSNK